MDRINLFNRLRYASSTGGKSPPQDKTSPDMAQRSVSETDNTLPFSRLRGPVRLRTLTTLRWLAVIGQTLAILIVHFGLGFELPLGICLGIIAISAWLNIFIMLRFSAQRFLSDKEASLYLGFDILQLCGLLFLTGGLENPFATLILAPATIAASVLPIRQTVLIALLALCGIGLLSLFHLPLPWVAPDDFTVPDIYVAGVWAALSFSVLFFCAYAHRIAIESAQMRSALAATQIILSREERLSALGGLAAAAAHELGTPLATMQVTAREMAEELKGNDPIDRNFLREDADLLVSQAHRCRDILGRLSSHGDEGDAMHNQVRLDSLLKEAASPFLDQANGAKIIFETAYDPSLSAPPILLRRPEIIYGLRNFIENALRFAKEEVLISAIADEDQISITISDDGPGFSPEVLSRLGEPYVNLKPRNQRAKVQRVAIGTKEHETSQLSGYEGMGLGFFIAKTLLERTQAVIYFENLHDEHPDKDDRQSYSTAYTPQKIDGAMVSAVWPTKALRA